MTFGKMYVLKKDKNLCFFNKKIKKKVKTP